MGFVGREPFTPSSLTFLPARNYYMAQVFFLPIFGVTVWLLVSSFAHVVLRVAGKASNFDLVLNIVGIGMLIPMPVTASTSSPCHTTSPETKRLVAARDRAV
jgi:hypothetical protein